MTFDETFHASRFDMLSATRNKLPNTNKSQIKNGITVTVDPKNYNAITLNGTATSQLEYNINAEPIVFDSSKSYILSGSVGGSVDSYFLIEYDKTTNVYGVISTDGDSSVFVPKEGHKYFFQIVVRSGATVNNVQFLPTLRESNEANTEYIPYLKSNFALMDEVSQSEVDRKGLELFGWIAPKVGDVYDYIENGVYHKRVSRTDLSILKWTYVSGWNCWTTTDIPQAKYPLGDWDKFNGLCDVPIVPTDSGYGASDNVAFARSIGQFYYRNGSSSAKPTGYLYYELATEQTYSIYNSNVLDAIGTTTNLFNPTAQSRVTDGVIFYHKKDMTQSYIEQ